MSRDMEADSDLVNTCQHKLKQFRIKELKDVLTQLGLSKQGKKQDLVDRILALLYDEGTPGLYKNNVNGKKELVELIDDTYRKMQETGVADSSAKKQNGTGSSRSQVKEEAEESHQLERKIRCPCGGSVASSDLLIQCLDSDCNVWQHSSCVIIPEKPMDTICMPSQFLCEICRVKRADPFWATMAHPLSPVKLASSTTPLDGTNPIQSVEKSFKLTRVDRDLLQKAEYDVQAWCILLNDSVPYRVQWPKYADLQVNGIPVRAVNRPSSQQLGANGRDDGVKITLFIAEGVNKISLSGSDARTFCLGVRLVRRRTLQQVLGMIPKEPDGEPFESALARVQRCIGGGLATENNDSDSDLEVIADSITVNLRCPLSGSRMKTAGRFRPCAHMGCFDLETFVELNERSRKWQCPICLKNYSLEDIIVDPFFNRILNMMQSFGCGEEINEIDMKPDGSWRVKKAREVGELAQWQCPDASIEGLFKSEDGQRNCTASKPGIQNDVGGCHVDGPQGVGHSFMNQQDNEAEFCGQNVITMSSTTSENGNDDGDPSINQDGGAHFGISDSNEHEISSGLLSLARTHGTDGQGSNLSAAHADVIILSDSEDEDDVHLVCPEAALPVDSCANHDGYSLSAPANVLNSYPPVASGEGPCVFNGTDIDVLKCQSPFPSNSQGGAGIDFFGTAGGNVDEHNSASCPEPINQMLTSDSPLDPVHDVMDSHDPRNSSFDHQFASVSANISLEVLLPCPPVSTHELSLLSSIPSEDWMSLKTGGNEHEGTGSNVEVHNESAAEDGLDLQNQFRSREDTLIQEAPGESGSESDPTVSGKKSDGPFSFPRQRRTTRKRGYDAAFRNLVSK